MDSAKIKEELMEDDDEYDEEYRKFVPEVIIKKEHRNHNVIVKEATFQSEFEEDDDDFDPFSNEVRKPKKSKPLKKVKAPPPVAKEKSPVPQPSPPKPEVKEEVTLLKTEVKVKLDDDHDDCPDMGIPGNDDFSPFDSDSDEDVNLSVIKKKIEIVKKKKAPVRRYNYKKDSKSKLYHSRDRVRSKRYKSLHTGKHQVKRKNKKDDATTSDSEDDSDIDDAEDENNEETTRINENETGGNNSKSELARYQRGPLITKDLNYRCMHHECKKVQIESAFEFVDHMEIHHQKTLSVVRIRNFIPWERETGAIIKIHPDQCHNLMRCEKCTKQYSSHEGLWRHQDKGSCAKIKANYICMLCNKDLKRPDLRKLHMNLEHPEEEVESELKCLICEELFQKKEGLTEHYQEVHGTNFPCKYCEKIFKIPKTLSDHIKSQHRKIGLKCDVCGKVSRSMKELNAHREIHNEEATVKCPDCDIMFTSQVKMNYHWGIKHDVKDYPCDVCDKIFKSKIRMYNHKYIVHKEKNYRCHLCAKAFLRDSELNNHILWHEGKWKPKKRFQQKKAVDPANFQKYHCSICNKGFSEAKFYNKHMKRKTVHMSYKCQKCEMEILGLYNYREHCKGHQGPKKRRNHQEPVPQFQEYVHIKPEINVNM